MEPLCEGVPGRFFRPDRAHTTAARRGGRDPARETRSRPEFRSGTHFRSADQSRSDCHGDRLLGFDGGIARSRFPHISFRKANAEKIPFDENSFDVVVSNFVVHHLARPDAVFREVARVLKPEGRFAFTVFAAPEKQSSIGAFFQAVEANHSLEELPHGPLFGVTDLGLYSSMLREAGLLSPQFDFRSILWRTSSLDPVVESFRCWGNIELLPEEVQERIDAATRGNLQPYATDDGYALPHEVLLGSASAG